MFISDFFVVKPAHTIKQSTLLNWISHIQQHPKDLQKILDGTSFIEFRGTVVEDCLHKNLDQMLLFNTSIDPKGSTINQRLKLYEEKALNCFEEIYNTHSIPDHLIHVTCTGYLAPSPAQKYIAKNLPNQTTVTHSYHMGCYGAFPALRIAKGFLANSKDIDIVHTEFCTLHFDPSNIQLEQLVIHALFADGCIRYKISNEPKGFKVIALHEELIEDSIQSMSWTPSTHNMQMTIAKDVPLKIGRKIEKSLQEFCEKNGFLTA